MIDQLKSLWHVSVLLKDGLFVKDAIVDAALHQEYAILVEGSHEVLPPCDNIFHAFDSVFYDVKALLLMKVNLPQNNQEVLSCLHALLTDIVPRQ